MRYSIWIFCWILFVNGACKTDKGPLCTQEAKAGLQVRVISKNTFEPIIEGVSVLAISNEFQEELTILPGEVDFLGLFERPGTYTVIVNGNGFTPITYGNIVIEKDECHVITRFLQVFI
jgi:hypothetical protein